MMNDFFLKEEYGPADIQYLIDTGTEESIYLEFKASGSLGTSDGKKNELAKDVSAFANSDGGIIVYGIEEVDHKAGRISFIDGTIYTKEWLEQIVQSRISPRLSSNVVFPVRFDDDLHQTVYILKIPRSISAPHMTADKKFFRRFNFQSVQMEEYEIRDLYNRKDKTNLEIEDILISSNGSSSSAQRLAEAKYKISFQVKNVGSVIEEQYKLEIAIPIQILATNNPANSFKIRHENECVIFSIPNSSSLFQNERTTLIDINLTFTWHTMKYLETPIKCRLYYSSGIKERVFLLQGRLFHHDMLIENLF